MGEKERKRRKKKKRKMLSYSGRALKNIRLNAFQTRFDLRILSKVQCQQIAQQRFMTTHSWSNGNIEPGKSVSEEVLVNQLNAQQVASSNELVPWFLKNMPQSYFRQVSEKARMSHLKALSALYGAGADLTLTLKSSSEDKTQQTLTLIRPNKIGLLHDVMEQFPSLTPLEIKSASSYVSFDQSLVLSIFYLRTGAPRGKATCPELFELASKIQAGEFLNNPLYPSPSDHFLPKNLEESLQLVDPVHITTAGERRFLKQLEMYHKISGTDGVEIDIEEYVPTEPAELGKHKKAFWVTVAIDDVSPHSVLTNFSAICRMRELENLRTHLNIIGDNVCMVRFLLATDETVTLTNEGFWGTLKHDIKRMCFVDDSTINLVLFDQPSLGLRRAEIVTALASLVHTPLSKENPWTFSHSNILQMLRNKRYLKHIAAVADLFVSRFDPAKTLPDTQLTTLQADLREAVTRNVEDNASARLLIKMIDSVGLVYRTNLFMPNRSALSIRVNPELMKVPNVERDLPYGVFFVHGRDFNAFHVRFRDIARGGLRLVSPGSFELFAAETARHFDEAYGLAYAQQLKNKDIPEGGSKAVLLLNTLKTKSEDARDFALRKSVKSFTDAILDLIVKTDETSALVVDFFAHKERLYLGPDEQVIPDDISWVVERAEKRGLPNPSTFMSSKADEGINHKEFGVTSEGVTVFLDVALRYCGINPKSNSFTVKITGGPNGDVAGNCMQILYREYGENAKVVGVADHSGCAEDPNGLNWSELLRLVADDEPIAKFDKTKLGPRGEVHLVTTEEGMVMRNTMHNRVVADAFIPAGGRPGTISISNWKNFLKPDGTPSSKLIVEGANLFIEPAARQALFTNAGVLIVKDSSANKCGVICSSYEIIASMLLEKEQFKSIKKELVSDVLKKLRKFARMEAELLFKDFTNYPGALPIFSERISRAINDLKDAIVNDLINVKKEDLVKYLPIVEDHLPQKLLDVAGNHILEKVPEAYLKAAIASTIASQFVYREGPTYISTLPKDRLGFIAFKYREVQAEVNKLIDQIQKSDLGEQEKNEAISLLRHGGARTRLEASFREEAQK
eukprot:c21644_g1_i1.p1 GENE.c21644_g1_i1~~c21644_g1_i1.p1  ORF type:complete len:1079 (+),score=527.64 c21644_g1_i1:2-3238(+)